MTTDLENVLTMQGERLVDTSAYKDFESACNDLFDLIQKYKEETGIGLYLSFSQKSKKTKENDNDN
jgi:hypothetical protein